MYFFFALPPKVAKHCYVCVCAGVTCAGIGGLCTIAERRAAAAAERKYNIEARACKKTRVCENKRSFCVTHTHTHTHRHIFCCCAFNHVALLSSLLRGECGRERAIPPPWLGRKMGPTSIGRRRPTKTGAWPVATQCSDVAGRRKHTHTHPHAQL